MRRLISLALIAAFVAFVSPAPGALAQGTLGTVNGTAVDTTKNPLANHTVRIRNVQTRQITASTQSSGSGGFSFAGVTPGDYVIQIVAPGPAGTVIATSATVSVTAGATATITVTASALAGLAAAGGSGLAGLAGLFTGTSLLVVTAAGIAGVVIAVEATQDEGSPSR